MKKILLETSFSKIYMIVMIIVTLLILGGYFSYAMFTVTKEKENAISIVTGNLTYELKVDEEEGNTLTVPSNSRKDFIVTLSNPNNRVGRFNFYYEGSLPNGVDIGYIEKEGVNTPPSSTGINLEKVDTTGSSNTYIVRVSNTTESDISIELGVSVGLDYNDLELPENGHLLRKITSTGTVKEVIEDDIMNRLNYEDSEQTFVTGSNPYNYIWYSGKLWRVVSIDPSDNSVKLVTQWNISAIPYNPSNQTNFDGSYMEEWLNDTTVDGFLGNLRDYENFIVTDAVWDTAIDSSGLGSFERPDGTIVTDPVGLLNMYEYQTSYRGTTYGNGYLNNELQWWLITPYSSTKVWQVNSRGAGANSGSATSWEPTGTAGIRPSIVLKSSIKIVDGDGSEDNPYRLEGDNDNNLEGVKLNTRYSGEYIRFGNDENNLYRIVSHETEGLTKITSDEPLRENGIFKTSAFSSVVNDIYYSANNAIGTFLNGEYLTNYIDSSYSNMIENSTTWYLGNVDGGESYKLAKYTDINMADYTTSTETKVGLLRMGELMSGQFNYYYNGVRYWLLTSYNNEYVRTIFYAGNGAANSVTDSYGIKPSLNLKQNVIITEGLGTKEQPFVIALQ